jgi:hypothetical protein
VFASKKTAWPSVYHIVQEREAFAIMLLIERKAMLAGKRTQPLDV